MRKMLNFINRGDSRRLTLSKYDMLGMGTWMMKGLIEDVNMQSIDEFITMVNEIGIKIIACTTSYKVMGVPEESFRSEVTSLAGATYFLREARGADITLFI